MKTVSYLDGTQGSAGDVNKTTDLVDRQQVWGLFSSQEVKLTGFIIILKLGVVRTSFTSTRQLIANATYSWLWISLSFFWTHRRPLTTNILTTLDIHWYMLNCSHHENDMNRTTIPLNPVSDSNHAQNRSHKILGIWAKIPKIINKKVWYNSQRSWGEWTEWTGMDGIGHLNSCFLPVCHAMSHNVTQKKEH